LLEGWSVSGSTLAQAGNPLTILDANTGTAYGTSGTNVTGGASRAQLCPGITQAQIVTSGSVKERLGGASGGPGWFNTNAFCAAPVVPFAVPDFFGALPTDFGNSGIGIIRGPGQFNTDISISKITKIAEGHTIQFRTEFFNAFNTPQFANPTMAGTTLADRNSPAFGQITATSANPRLIQFALRYTF
jgi:hypothetical protein